MKKSDVLDTFLGIIVCILFIAAVLLFVGMIFLLPVAGGDTPSILDLIVNLFK